MGDKIIKLASLQGFSDSWKNAGAPSRLNLVDFVIPSGYVVDLSKSYIAYNTSISVEAGAATADGGTWHGTEPVNAMLKMNGLVTGNDSMSVPNVILSRNAAIQCDRVGQIENIRRCDTLKSSLWSLEHDAEERIGDMNAFTAPKGPRGVGNQSSYFLDARTSGDATGANGTGDEASRQLSRDVKIPLKDMWGICEADDWSTQKQGETRMHLETNWSDIKLEALGGQEATSLSPVGGHHWGKMNDVDAVAANTPLNSLVTAIPYVNSGLLCPFFVGQRVIIKAGTVSQVLNPATNLTTTGASRVIKSMTKDPATGNITLTFVVDISTNVPNTGTAATNFQGITVAADNTYLAGATIAVNRAELVLFTKDDSTPSADEYNFVTYTTEQDNGNGIQSFSRGYVLEASAQNLMVALLPNGMRLPTTEYVSYRYAINNEDMTGNRSIPFDTPIQYDRLTRCLDSASPTTEWRNAQQKFFKNQPNADGTSTQAASYEKRVALICETLMQTDTPKYLDLQIESVAAPGTVENQLAQIILYKQHFRSI